MDFAILAGPTSRASSTPWRAPDRRSMSALSSTRETHIGSDLSVFPFDADLGWLHRHTDTHTEVLRPPPPQRRSIPAPSPHDGPDRVPNRKVSAFRLEQVQVELVSWRPDHRERDGFDIRPRTTFQFKTLDRVHCGPSVRWREDGGRRFGSDDFRNGFESVWHLISHTVLEDCRFFFRNSSI